MTKNYVKRLPMLASLLTLSLLNTALLDAQGVKVGNAEEPGQKKETTQKKDTTQFLRVLEDRNGQPLAMQTAITRYRPDEGSLVVDLVGVVHIGEADYYEQLNRQFEVYDVVLFELVAPEGTIVPAGGKRTRTSRVRQDSPSNRGFYGSKTAQKPPA